VLRLSKVNSYYGHLHVLWDIDLEVEDAAITGLIGPNGAGKSTLLRTILGSVPSVSGIIDFNGKLLTGKPPKMVVRSGIAYVPEGRRVFPEMTVKENLELGVMTPKARSERERNLNRVYQIFPILKERKDQYAGTLSGGELQMLALARGFMGSPELLMIDEPSLGLSPIAAATVFRTIREIGEGGTTILIVEQNVPRLLTLATKAYLLENGHIVRAGKASDLRNDPHIVKSYLGL
jgi:branched-chain amino acid transport system ATP-binding protein